jgi:hypothetical protein
MRSTNRSVIPAALVWCALAIAGCGGSGSEGSAAGSYTSVGDEGLAFDFKSGGAVTMSAKALNVSSSGTYTVDGDKLVVTMDGQEHTFIRDGKCIEDARHMFGKLCQGGKAGAASNVSTRKPPVTDGVWVSKNAEGDFRLEFKPGNRAALTGSIPGGKSDTLEGMYTVDGDRVDVRLPQGMPLQLRFVNGAYETTSLGLPMKFTKGS